MENNIDKYFRDNLHDRKFEMKDEYWLAAEKLLEADERRKRRGVFFWWFFAGGLLLLSVPVALYCWSKYRQDAPSMSQSNQQAHISVVERSSPANESSEPQDSRALPTPLAPKATIPTKEIDDKAVAGTAFDEAKKHDSAAQGSKTRSTKATENQSVANQKTRSSNFLKTTDSQPPTTNAPAIGTAELGSAPSVKPLTASDNQPALALDLPSEKQPEQAPDRAETPAKLALLLSFVQGNFAKPTKGTEVQKIELDHPKRVHLGIVHTQVAQMGLDSGEQRFLGQRTGLQVQFDLRNGWYLGTGLQYHQRSGTFSNAKTALQLRYSFGVRVDTLALRPQSLHYATVPMLLGWQRSGHQLEGGLLLDYLAGVRGELGRVGLGGVFHQRQKGWMTTDGYHRMVPTAQFSYRYQALRKWAVGLSASYSLKEVAKQTEGKFSLQERNKFLIGLQITYQLF